MAKKQESLLLFPELLQVTESLSDEQFGVLIRAAYAYRFGGTKYSGGDAVVDIAFRFVASQIDRTMENSSANQSNARRRWGSKPDLEVCESMQTDAEVCEGMRHDAEVCESMQTDAPFHSIPIHSNPIHTSESDAPVKQTRKPRGEFGWVKLTDDEFNRLINDLGEAEVKRCIAYVDESAQSTGNKNKWRDWNLVVRKCNRQGWGMNLSGGYGTGRVPMGASGELGNAELEAIQRLLRE